MIDGNNVDTSTNHRKLDTAQGTIDERKEALEILTNQLTEGDFESFTIRIIQDKIQDSKQTIVELETEKQQVESLLAQVELNHEFTDQIRIMVQQIRGNLSDANFNQKRSTLDKLNLQAVIRVEDGNRWSYLTFKISIKGLSFNLQEQQLPYLPRVWRRTPNSRWVTFISRRPARRAFESRNIYSLEQLSMYSAAKILTFHGMGPSSIPKLRQALESKDLGFREELTWFHTCGNTIHFITFPPLHILFLYIMKKDERIKQYT